MSKYTECNWLFFIKKRVFVYDDVFDVQTCLYVCKKRHLVVDQREKPKGKGNILQLIVYRDLINSISESQYAKVQQTSTFDHIWESN